jgi:DNA-binding winged helix-turn-helix (wHTH) protein/tetratricopeptide (TPR) repeat protein
MDFRFHDLRLDTVNQCVWQGDRRITLTPKAFGVLRYLVEHSGRLITHDELLQAQWAETFVQPEVLRKYVLEIRKALRDSPATPRFVETLPKRGYQFIAPVTLEQKTAQVNRADNRPSVFVGRESAMAHLNERYTEARQGTRQIVFVTGEAGIGKTTLLEAFKEQVTRDRDVKLLHGQCVEGFGGREPYYPLLDALGRVVRSPESASVVQVLASRAPTWLVQIPSAIKPEQQAQLRQEVTGATRERMVREICEAIESLAATCCLVVTLEDLHWVDHSTLDVISALARRRDSCKLLLIGTYRPVDVILSGSPLKTLKQDLLVHRLCDELPLERFGVPDISAYLTARFPGNAFPAELLEQLLKNSDGNALFMVALVDDLVQNQVISGQPGHWKLSEQFKRFRLEFPDTIREMFELLLAQLSMEERTILRAASVVGERFSVLAVSAVLEIDSDRVESVCEGLVEREQFISYSRIELPGEFPAGQYEFKHTLYRGFLYKKQSPSKRRALHLRIAERMESLLAPSPMTAAGELALHFEAAGEYDRTIRYLFLASETADQRHAPKDTIQILRRALHLVHNLHKERRQELELQILSRIAGAHYSLGEMNESADLYSKVALRAAEQGDSFVRVQALIREASSASFFDPDRCIATCQQAVEVGAHLKDSELKLCAQLLSPLWRIVFGGWRKEDAETCAAAMEKLEAFGEPSGSLEDRIRYGRILYAQVQCIQADYQGALKNLEACLPGLLETQSTWEYLSSHMVRAVAYMGLGRFGDALHMLRSVLEWAERACNDPWIRSVRGAMAHLRYLAFDFEGAVREAKELLQAGWQVPGQAWTLVSITAGLCELELGNPREALACFENAQDGPARPRGFLDWYWGLLGLFGSSRAWLAINNISNAERDADLFLHGTHACADRSLQALAWALKAELRNARHQNAEAKAHTHKALSTMTDNEVPVFAWRIHAIAAESLRKPKDTPEAEQHRARARDILLGLANSLKREEPLRASILNSVYFRQLDYAPVNRNPSETMIMNEGAGE